MKRFRLADKIVTKILFWKQIAAQRSELGKLSDELLKDIGISRTEAAREANRYFWDTDPVEDDSLMSRRRAALKYNYN